MKQWFIRYYPYGSFHVLDMSDERIVGDWLFEWEMAQYRNREENGLYAYDNSLLCVIEAETIREAVTQFFERLDKIAKTSSHIIEGGLKV